MPPSAGLSADETVAVGLLAMLCAALRELADVGTGFLELVAQRFQHPKGRLNVERETQLFARVSLLVRKMLAFEVWLQSGGAADEAKVARLAARLAAGRDATARDGAGGTARAACVAPARERGERNPAGDEQATFEAWFSSRTTEDVVTSFQRDLSALSRQLGKQLEIVRIDEIVYRIIALIDEAVEARLLKAAGENAYKPLPFVAAWKAARARGALDSG